MPDSGQAPTLQYGKPLPWHQQRKWRRRTYIALMAVLLLAGWHWKMSVWRWVQIQYYQRQCLRYARPADQVVAVSDIMNDQILTLAAKDSQYAISYDDDYSPELVAHAAVPFDRLIAVIHPNASYDWGNFDRYDQLQKLGPVTLSAQPKIPVLFLHERINSAGHRRLVAVFISFDKIEPTDGRWLYLDIAVFECGLKGLHQVNPLNKQIRLIAGTSPKQYLFFAGQPDPADSARFTINYTVMDYDQQQLHGTIIGKLGDDDAVDLDNGADKQDWRPWKTSSYSEPFYQGFDIGRPYFDIARPYDNAGPLGGLNELRTLYLEGSKMEVAGLAHIKALNLNQLKKLYLNGPNVTDDGLADLQGWRQLETLSLAFTHVTDAGLVYLRGLAALRDLDLSDTQVTEQGVADLKKALPACRISHSPYRVHPTSRSAN